MVKGGENEKKTKKGGGVRGTRGGEGGGGGGGGGLGSGEGQREGGREGGKEGLPLLIQAKVEMHTHTQANLITAYWFHH